MCLNYITLSSCILDKKTHLLKKGIIKFWRQVCKLVFYVHDNKPFFIDGRFGCAMLMTLPNLNTSVLFSCHKEHDIKCPYHQTRSKNLQQKEATPKHKVN